MHDPTVADFAFFATLLIGQHKEGTAMPCEIIIFPGSSTSDKKEVAPEVRKEICEFAIEQAIREARRGGKRLLDALPSGVLDKMSSRGKFLYVVFESMGILQDALKKENKKYTELSDEIL